MVGLGFRFRDSYNMKHIGIVYISNNIIRFYICTPGTHIWPLFSLESKPFVKNLASFGPLSKGLLKMENFSSSSVMNSHGDPPKGPFAWECSRWSSCVASKSCAFGDAWWCVTTKSGSNIDRENKIPPQRHPRKNDTGWWLINLFYLDLLKVGRFFILSWDSALLNHHFVQHFFPDHQRVADLSSAIHDKWQRWCKLLHPIFRRDHRTLSWLCFICFFWGVVVGVPSLKLT